MRKMVESTLVTLDGLIGDPHIWAGGYFDDEATSLSLDRLNASDAMLMGRRTYEIFSTAWPFIDTAYARRINEMPKYVVSSTLAKSDWNNTTILPGDPVKTVAELKEQGDRDIVMYGHGMVGQALLENGLMDEVHYCIHPLLLGGDNVPLHRRDHSAKLQLTGVKTLKSGAVILSYVPSISS